MTSAAQPLPSSETTTNKDKIGMESVELLNVEKHYSGFHALKNINLTTKRASSS
jgi:multiple sugar transport system ATP-binding protein